MCSWLKYQQRIIFPLKFFDLWVIFGLSKQSTPLIDIFIFLRLAYYGIRVEHGEIRIKKLLGAYGKSIYDVCEGRVIYQPPHYPCFVFRNDFILFARCFVPVLPKDLRACQNIWLGTCRPSTCNRYPHPYFYRASLWSNCLGFSRGLSGSVL